MDMLFFIYTASLLFFASIGAGVIIMRPIGRYLPPLSIWLETAVAYFLGQAVLGSSLILLGLAGWFTPLVIKSIFFTLSAAALFSIFISRSLWRDSIKRVYCDWISASFVWKFISLLLFILLILSVSTLYGGVAGDAYAFYLALPKVISASHTVTPLPGYESFAYVGYLAEILLAALYSLGLPDASPRCYSLINFFPILMLFYGLARECRLSRRGALIVVIMVMTSSAGSVLWTSGKTDLFAVGPAVAAYLFSIMCWDKGVRKGSLFMAGVFTGFACVFKLSYIIPLIPSILVLCNWRFIIEGFQSFYYKKWKLLLNNFYLSFKSSIIFIIAFVFAVTPHIVKNLFFKGPIIGTSGYESFYSTATTIKIILSYPLALTFGHYWAQLGTLSPLFIAFAPLLLVLPKTLSLSESKIGAIGFTTFIGLVFWVFLFPSYLMPRYFLATLFMFSIPIAAGADRISRQKTLLSKIISIAVCITIVLIPLYTNFQSQTDGFNTFRKIKISNLFSSGRKSFLYTEDFNYTLAHKAINAKAHQYDRVLMLTYYRLWLRPDLLQKVSTSYELVSATDPKGNFWNLIREKQFKFILWDKDNFKLDPGLFIFPPKDIKLVVIYNDPSLSAYELNIKDQ